MAMLTVTPLSADLQDWPLDPVSAPATRTAEFTARAYEPGTRRRLYEERHRVEYRRGKPVSEIVTYHGARGRLFARKTLHYGPLLTAPNFRFEDLRNGRIEQVERRGLNWVVSRRESARGAFERDVLRPSVRVLVDEGYRMLLSRHLPRLQAGGSVVGEAIVPSRLGSFDMRFRGRGMVPRAGRKLLHVHLDMDDFLLRLVGPSADLYLDIDSRRLVEFVGLANIRDDDGELQQARILYRYPAPH